jgi:hypothetical protein
MLHGDSSTCVDWGSRAAQPQGSRGSCTSYALQSASHAHEACKPQTAGLQCEESALPVGAAVLASRTHSDGQSVVLRSSLVAVVGTATRPCAAAASVLNKDLIANHHA